MTSEIRTGSLGGNPSTEKTAKNLDLAASEITALQAKDTLVGAGTTGTVAATGSAQGDAAALTLGFNLVTAADGTKGVVLPAAVAGQVVHVKNAAGSTLKVYPASSDAINAIAANGAFSMLTVTSATFVSYDATTWYTIPLVAS
jgi:hypothetical protein